MGGTTFDYKPAPEQMLQKRDRWAALAKRYNVTLPVLAMKFALLPHVVTKIAVGVKSPREVELNVNGVLERLDTVKVWQDAQKEGLLPKNIYFGL